MRSRHIHSGPSSFLRYRHKGEGNALLLLHGFPENGDLWVKIGERLSKDYRVIIPDIPGSGKSKLEQENVSLFNLGLGIYDICITEEIEKVVLIGHSMGGYINLAIADFFPERVVGLSLVHSTAKADSEEKKETRRKTIKLIEKGGKKPFVQQMIPSLFSESYKKKHPEKIESQIESGLAMKDESMIAYYKAIMMRPDSRDVLKNAPFPVQMILGEEDNLLPINSMTQQTHLSNVNFVSIYPQCGHMSMLEQPEKLYNDLKMFADYCYRS